MKIEKLDEDIFTVPFNDTHYVKSMVVFFFSHYFQTPQWTFQKTYARFNGFKKVYPSGFWSILSLSFFFCLLIVIIMIGSSKRRNR